MVESVSYSQRTANRLMQLFEEYGDKLFASTEDGGSSNSSALTNLTYYQAFLLLGIPEDEREEFVLQKLALISALIHKPKLLVFDEPPC